MSAEAPEGVFGSSLGAFLGCSLGSQLEVRGAYEKVLEMRSSWFQNLLSGIIKNRQNVRDIL